MIRESAWGGGLIAILSVYVMNTFIRHGCIFRWDRNWLIGAGIGCWSEGSRSLRSSWALGSLSPGQELCPHLQSTLGCRKKDSPSWGKWQRESHGLRLWKGNAIQDNWRQQHAEQSLKEEQVCCDHPRSSCLRVCRKNRLQPGLTHVQGPPDCSMMSQGWSDKFIR